ncbi:hypothetical protein ACOBV9_19070 (plasmid) [Pseudoalteromonas espejiana]
MIAPATGIKQQFYANFATYLQQHGFGVITFDNRGIGQSLNRSIKKVRPHYKLGASKTCQPHLSICKNLSS